MTAPREDASFADCKKVLDTLVGNLLSDLRVHISVLSKEMESLTHGKIKVTAGLKTYERSASAATLTWTVRITAHGKRSTESEEIERS